MKKPNNRIHRNASTVAPAGQDRKTPNGADKNTDAAAVLQRQPAASNTNGNGGAATRLRTDLHAALLDLNNASSQAFALVELMAGAWLQMHSDGWEYAKEDGDRFFVGIAGLKHTVSKNLEASVDAIESIAAASRA